MENPFRPTAGATPPDLVGRGGVLDEFAYGSPLCPAFCRWRRGTRGGHRGAVARSPDPQPAPLIT